MGLRIKINAYYCGLSAVPATSYEAFDTSAVHVTILDSQPGLPLAPRAGAAVGAGAAQTLLRNDTSGRRRGGRRRLGHRTAVVLRWAAVSPVYLIPGLLLGAQFLAFEVIAAVIGGLALIARRFRPQPLYDYPAWVRRVAGALRMRLRRRH